MVATTRRKNRASSDADQGTHRQMMKLMAAGFSQYLFHLAELHRNLREHRYLIRPVN